MRVLLTVIIWYCCLPLLKAQDSLHLSLENILQKMETNYPAILQYQGNIKALEAEVDGAKAWMPPTFSAGLMRWPYNLSMLKEQDAMNQAGLAFTLEQMITNPGKLHSRKDYVSSLADIEKSEREWTKNELRREAKLLYYRRHVAEKKLAIIQQSRELLQLLLGTAEAKFSNNQSQLQTIYKAKARLAELDNMLLMFQSQAGESTIGLNVLMVSDAATPFTIDTLIEPAPPDYAGPATGAISERSDIAAMSKRIRSMQLEQHLMKVGNRPDFGLRAEHMKMFGMPNQWSVMGMITLPIVPWASRMYTSETKSMGFRIEGMEEQKHTMELMAGRMRAEKLLMLSSEIRQYDNYRLTILPAFENNLQANLLAFKQDTGDFFVLLDAWEMLLMKKMERYDKLFTVLKLQAEYDYELEKK